MPRKTDNDHWCTPRELVELIHDFFGGPPDLDPCSNPGSVVRARHFETERGLLVPWLGNVYINPPYSAPGPWVTKGVANDQDSVMLYLLPSSTSTRWFHDVFNASQSTLFFEGRLSFIDPATGLQMKGNRGESMLNLLVSGCEVENISELVGRFWDVFNTLGSIK